jgi:pilus assembly protein CpaC
MMLQRRAKQRVLMAMSLLLPSTLGWPQESDLNINERASRPTPGKVTPATINSLPGLRCNGEPVSPAKMALPIGKSTLLRLPEEVTNRTLANPAVAQAMLVAPETLYLLGVEVGTTNMILQGKSGKCTAIDVTVTMDPGALQATLSELMPEEKDIRVTAAADSLVLSGTVTDAMVAARVYDLALAFVRRPALMSAAAQQEGMANTSGSSMQTSLSTNPALQQLRIVNLLQVTAAQQVMLEVKVAEVSKILLDKLGVSVTGSPTSGSLTYSILSNFLTGSAGTVGINRASGSGINLDAEKKDSLIKILAEPNVMAISGQEGSFLAGGRILIPVGQDMVGGFGRVTLEEKEFGVGLKFTPTVLSGGRINLRVSPEVSELSREGIGINAVNGSRSILPLITTRRASTTVQLADGQSFAIGGLIKNNTTANIKAFPILGEIPILGALFRSSDFQRDRTELVFIVTPRLVKPLPADYRLPTDGVLDPSRKDLFIDGKMEGGVKPRSDDGAKGFQLK